jgi:Spy/CpxP family protein refolding chaperone
MVRLMKTALALGLVVLVADLAGAQQPGRGFPGGGGVAALLANPDVAKELKLTEDQVTKVKEVGQKVREKFKDSFGQLKDTPQEERQKKFQEIAKGMADETNKALSGVLNSDQTKRLKQLELQMQGSRAFSDADVQKSLGLTDEQKEKIKTISDDAGKAMRELFQGGNFQEAAQKMQTLRKDTMEKVTAVLTDAQKKSWKDMTGEPFEFKFQGFRRPNNNQ